MSIAFLTLSQAAEPPCVLEIPVYDAFGTRLDFKVTHVSPEGNNQLDLLSLRPEEITAIGDQVSFSGQSLLRRVIVITLEGPKGKKITQPVLIMQCPQRVSLRYGEAYGDAIFLTVRGHATGCKFTKDWWIRALPMFGASSLRAPFEGYIQPDGAFSLSGQMAGERHIVIIGKNKQPVKAFGVDIMVDRSNDLGNIDLSGQCPQ